ncbi:ABC transporter permease subunit [Cohnella rhizosphaerae]|uniref:ABC transporter permease subunit n=1 Tax=Cohnella rhizosphaerae TaxID=1457232 RepID=UPI0030B909BD
MSKRSRLRAALRDYDLYLLLLPGLAALLIFKYVPMFGAIIAFKDYRLGDGIWGSPWVGWQNFEALLRDEKFYQVLRNTVLINLYKLIFQFPLPILLALMISEVRNVAFKRAAQTITYLPHFLSWVIISTIFINLLSPHTGILKDLFQLLGMQDTMMIADERFFRSVLVMSAAWKETGWSSIIYLSAILSIDTQQYEAARMDGAGRFRQIWHVTLPGIRSVIFFCRHPASRQRARQRRRAGAHVLQSARRECGRGDRHVRLPDGPRQPAIQLYDGDRAVPVGRRHGADLHGELLQQKVRGAKPLVGRKEVAA